MGRGAPPWAQVKLRCVDDVMPPVGAELRVWNTGRRYQVIGVRELTLNCVNKAAVDQFELGKEFYLDMTPAS